MNPKEKAHNALTAVFPNKKSIADFIKDSDGEKRLQSFVEFALRNGLIEAPTRRAFEAFIDHNSRPPINTALSDITMEVLIKNREKYLNTKMSNSALTDKINGLLAANKIKLPQLSSAMFTRLKGLTAATARRRDALRSFAFWIGHERSVLGNVWHYETLKELCRENDGKTNDISCGIRIAFSINSRGNIIGQDIITWMRRTIRSTLNSRTDLFPDKNPPKLKNYDLMTFQVDLPNTDQNAIPSSFANTLKKAITIAHQIAIRWIMSGFDAYNRFFSIGIAAGDFNEINGQLQAILTVKLPEDPLIRITDYARQCAMINHIKIITNQIPKEIELVSGEAFKVWWVTELSGMIYWHLVPGILGEAHCENAAFTSIDIMRQLVIPNDEHFLKGNEAIKCFLKFPHHPMLGYEIVRALVCRNKTSEAMEILNALLRVTPHHLNSRITRMVLYKFLAVEASNYYLSNMIFSMAEEDAEYILENLSYASEDFYYEYALLKLARFSVAVRELRGSNNDKSETMHCRPMMSDLDKFLNQAEKIIIKGMIVSSPTFDRILYLFLSIEVLKCVFAENIKGRGMNNHRLTCPADKIKKHLSGVILSLYHQAIYIDTSKLDIVIEVCDQVVKKDDNMISLDAYKPAQFFIRAAFYWDILPVRNVYTIKKALSLLNHAVRSAQLLAASNEPVYSMAGLMGQFVSADHFILQIESIIKEIEERYQCASALEKLDTATVIGSATDDLVMMTYFV